MRLISQTKQLKPPLDLTPSEWADKYRFLSPEDSAEPGKYRVDRAPYQRGILDALKTHQRVVLMCSAQVGKTLCQTNALGYWIDQSPGPILWISPTVEMAESTSKEKIAPMVRDSPRISALVDPSRSRTSGNTIRQKALDIETPIPTVEGWKKMGDIVPGDVVFDENGNPCKVTYVTPIVHNRPCYRVVFSDGNEIVADHDHPWQVERWKTDKSDGKAKSVLVSELVTTADLIKGVGGKRAKYSIPVTAPLNLPKAELPVHPYILGAWIGDGYSHAAIVVAGHQDAEEMRQILKACGAYGEFIGTLNDRVRRIRLDPPFGKEAFCQRGHEKARHGLTADGHCAECHRQFTRQKFGGISVDRHQPNSIRLWLKSLGVLKEKADPQCLKSIPSFYLRAARSQRIQLLQGLMDTDGSINKNGRCVFCTTLELVKKGISELLHSLGIKHTVSLTQPSYTHKGEKKRGQSAWVVQFVAPFDFPVFCLKRKVERQQEFIKNSQKLLRKNWRRQVVDVIPIDSVPVRCISVDSPSHLYLAGEAMIPTHNTFPGGTLTLAGANSPASLASRSIRYLLLDEIDRYPPSAGTEGDPMKLAEVRTKAFWNSRIFAVSTPTVKGASRIEKEFELSDRRHFYVPCPHCGHYQWLKWDGLTYEGKGTSAYKLGATDWLGYLCEVCGEIIEEKFKSTILSQGEWRSHAESRTAGFHLNELCSPFSSWRDMALAYEEARQEPQTYRVWFNTALGLPLEEDNREQGSWESLLPRVSDSSYQMGQVPEGALLLTSGVDVQADRLECAVFGWGESEQSWLIDYQVFLGDPQGEEVWEALQLFLEKDYNHPLGQSVRVKLAAVDTGFLTPEVYTQILKRRTWVAIKGRAGDRPLITPPTLQEVNVRGKKIKKGIKLYLLGVDQAKSVLLGRAKIQAVGPRYINLPADIDHDWLKGFMASEVRVKKFKGGLPYYTWEPVTGQRNEPLDCAVYAYAGAAIAGLSRINWEKMRQSLTVQEVPPPPKPEPEPPPKPPVDPRPNRRSGKQSKNWFTSH